MKIHIFGGPGSGKTTLATNLSRELNIPHYDLDYFRYKEEDIDYTQYEEEDVCEKKLKKVISKKSWITEGSYSDFAWPCFEKSDIIIILEPNFTVTNYRIMKRFLLHKLGIKRRHKPELWRNLPGLLRWNHVVTYKKLPAMKERIKPLNHKVIYLKRKFDFEELIKKIKKKKRKRVFFCTCF